MLLIHHSASRQHNHPLNSLAALQTCLEAGARVVEIDISPLADGEFVILHGPSLESETTGSGPIHEFTSEQMSRLNFVWQGDVTDEPVSLLHHALELVRSYPNLVELQLDLKPYAPLSDAVLCQFVAKLEPVKDRIRVTSSADWTLRRLHALNPELPLGFDPMLYLDFGPRDEEDSQRPPFRQGAFGYWDEHPLASRRWGPAAHYLAARAEALWVQAPADSVWYIYAPLLARAMDDGFDWIADLHERGAQVATWTLDASNREQVALAYRLADLGVDRIVTNDAPALANVLDADVVY